SCFAGGAPSLPRGGAVPSPTDFSGLSLGCWALTSWIIFLSCWISCSWAASRALSSASSARLAPAVASRPTPAAIAALRRFLNQSLSIPVNLRVGRTARPGRGADRAGPRGPSLGRPGFARIPQPAPRSSRLRGEAGQEYSLGNLFFG